MDVFANMGCECGVENIFFSQPSNQVVHVFYDDFGEFFTPFSFNEVFFFFWT
jgi:hypothetical protein